MVDIDKVLRYEEGLMTEDEIYVFFQELVDSDAAWSLQGSYGRMAESLIRGGLVIDTHNYLNLGENDCE